MQTKLLRVLQDGEVRPVGGERRAPGRRARGRGDQPRSRGDGASRARSARTSTTASPSSRVAIPPLRERREDIAAARRALRSRSTRRAREVRIVARRDGDGCAAHAWPGNVRQLENEVQRALVLASGGVIRDDDLSPELRDEQAGAIPDELDLKAHIDALERRLVRTALGRATGNQTRAAKLLGLSRFGLQKMMRRLGIAGVA